MKTTQVIEKEPVITAPQVEALTTDDVEVIPADPQDLANVRLTAKLIMRQTSDSQESHNIPGLPDALKNTEDEIFIEWNGTKISSESMHELSRTIRPPEGRDIYEMGDHSNKELTFVLYEGSMLQTEELSEILQGSLTVIEQSNPFSKALEELGKAAGLKLGAFISAKIGLKPVAEALAKKSQEYLVKALEETYVGLKSDGNSVLGSIGLSLSHEDEALSLAAESLTEDGKLIAEEGKMFKFHLTGAKADYALELALTKVEIDEEPLRRQVFLEKTEDKCSGSSILIQTLYGAYKLNNGEEAILQIPNNRIWWYCGGHREWVEGPEEADHVWVRKAVSGRNISWKFLRYEEDHKNEIGAVTTTVVQSETKKLEFLGNTHDACSSSKLLVQTIRSKGGTIAVRKGETKAIYLPDNEFWWYCGGSRGETEAPEGTNLVYVTRAPSGRSLSWACYHDPEFKPVGKFLGNIHDACSADSIIVQSKLGAVKVERGETKGIHISSNKFWWYCGGTREWREVPRGTNYVLITRPLHGRYFSWAFYKIGAPASRYKFLGNTHDACSGSLTIEGASRKVSIAKGQTKVIRVFSNRVKWKCGSSSEVSTLPARTNVVVVTRSASGRAFSWACYQDPKFAYRIFKSFEYDKCGDTNLKVVDKYGRRILVKKGQKRAVEVSISPRGYFYWYCGKSKERTRPDYRSTNLVIVQRASSGRSITWECYYEKK